MNRSALVERMFAIIMVLLLFAATAQADTEIVRGAIIKEIIIPAGNAETASVAFDVSEATVPPAFETHCKMGSGYRRVKFAKADKELLSLLMYADAQDKRVSFFFDPNGVSLGGISGHGVGSCELINVWTVE